MPMHDDNHVMINGCHIVWDGITRPDTNQDGSPKYSLKVVADPNNQDVALLNQIASNELQQGKFRGVLPEGGRMPTGQARQDEFDGMYPGWAVFNCNTNRLPDVYDENGQRLDPMQYGPLVYGGQKVNVLAHCYTYDKAGNRGVAAGLDGFCLVVSSNAPRQNFGGGGVDTAGAFGGQQQQNNQQQQQNNQQQQQYQQPPAQQQQQYQQPPAQQQQPPAQQQQPPAQQQQPPAQQQQPPAQQQYQQPPAQQQQPPAQQQYQQQNNNGGNQPNQAENFLPDQ